MKTATATPIVVRLWRADALADGRVIELTRSQIRLLRLLAAAWPGFYDPPDEEATTTRHTVHLLRKRGFPVVGRRGYGYRLDDPIQFEERPGG